MTEKGVQLTVEQARTHEMKPKEPNTMCCTYTKADTTKGGGNRSNERVKYGSATATIFGRSNPPVTNNPGNSDVYRILKNILVRSNYTVKGGAP